MLYPVRVLDPQGEVKRVISGEELELRHWGVGVDCPVCGKTYLPKVRRAPQHIVYDAPNHEPGRRKERSPINKHCSVRCREYAKKLKRKKTAKPKPVVLGVCQICSVSFPVRNKKHKVCSDKCRRVYGRKQQAMVDARARRQRLEKGGV